MRTLVKVRLPVEAGNKAIKDGSLRKIIDGFVNEHKPEASYFTLEEGMRTLLFVVDVKDSSIVPSIMEPFFMGLHASIESMPVMNHDELHAGLQRIAGRFSS